MRSARTVLAKLATYISSQEGKSSGLQTFAAIDSALNDLIIGLADVLSRVAFNGFSRHL
jgi:hypothetical protein